MYYCRERKGRGQACVEGARGVRVAGGLDKLDPLITILAPRRWGEERNAETPHPGSRGRARPRLPCTGRTPATDRGLRPPPDLQRDQHLAHGRVPREIGRAHV